jgi:LacI family transcriptional regulator
MEVAVEHLVALGHRRIAHIAGPADADTAKRRLQGFRRGLRGAGLAVSADAVVRASVDERDGFEAMRQLLELARRPTAVAVWSLSAAVGALAAAQRHRDDVPRELSVVAFHDAPMAEYLQPALTTVRMPLYELSETAVRLLVERIERGAATSVVIEQPAPVVVARASTAPLDSLAKAARR